MEGKDKAYEYLSLAQQENVSSTKNLDRDIEANMEEPVVNNPNQMENFIEYLVTDMDTQNLVTSETWIEDELFRSLTPRQTQTQEYTKPQCVSRSTQTNTIAQTVVTKTIKPRVDTYYRLTNIKGNEISHIDLWPGIIRKKFNHIELNELLSHSGTNVSFQLLPRETLLMEANFSEANTICINGAYKRKGVHQKLKLGAVIGFGKKYMLDRAEDKTKMEFVFQKITG